MLVKTQLFSIKLTRTGHHLNGIPAFIQVVNEKLHCTESLAKWKAGYCIRVKSPLQKRSTSLPVIPTPLCSLLFSQRADREWCRLNFRAWYVHRLLSSRAWCLPLKPVRLFFPHPPWRTIQFLETEHTHNLWKLVFYTERGVESPWYTGTETPGSNILKW